MPYSHSRTLRIWRGVVPTARSTAKLVSRERVLSHEAIHPPISASTSANAGGKRENLARRGSTPFGRAVVRVAVAVVVAVARERGPGGCGKGCCALPTVESFLRLPGEY